MNPSTFSKDFATRAFSRFPEWEQFAAWEECPHSGQAYLRIDIPCPYKEDRRIEIVTAGDEVTVRFDFYRLRRSFCESALLFVQDILEERLAVMLIQDAEGRREKAIPAGYEPAENESVSAYRIRSWSGAYDCNRGDLPDR